MEMTIAISIAGIALSAATFFIGRLSSARSDGEKYGSIASDLGYIKSSTDDIKKRLDDQDKKYADILISVTQLQQDMKNTFHQIDEIKGHIDEMKSRGGGCL